MNFFQIASEQPTLQPHTIFHIGIFPITNAMLMAWLVILLLFLFSLYVKKNSKLVPSTTQNLAEILVEGILKLVDQLTGSRTVSKQIFPLIGALFIYFGVSNLIGLVPGLSAFTYNGSPLLRTPTNDFNTTFAVALAMILLTQIASIKSFGLFGHIGKFVQVRGVIEGFKQGLGAGLMSVVHFFIGLLDIISEIAKIISLSVRLFGNMYAGEMMTAVLFGALALALPTPWLVMSLLAAVIQALVFGALTAAFYGMAVAKAEEDPRIAVQQ